MGNETGPRYEMPNGVTLENFDEFTFAECTKTSVKEKTVVQEKTVVRKNKVPKGRMDRFDKSEKKPVKPFNNKLRIAVIISIVLFIAVVAVVIIISSDNGRKIFPHYDDMDKLVVITEEDLNITFSGYDGAGRVNVELNVDSIVPKILKSMRADVEDSGLANERQARQLCYEYIPQIILSDSTDKMNFRLATDLYNGQTIEIVLCHEAEFDGSGEKNQEFDDEIILQLEKTIVECKGLEEMREADVFEDVKLAFYGDNGNLKAKCFYMGEISSLNSDCFRVDGDNGNFSYGDEVSVYISDASVDILYSEHGVTLQRESCIYTVEPKEEFVIKLYDITDENMAYMIDAGIKKVSDWAANSSTKVVYTDMEYYGAYLYSASKYDDESIGIYNKLIIVYTADVYDGESMDNSYSIYVPVIFENIVNETDGTQTIGDNISFRSNLHKDSDWGTFVFGYSDKNELMHAIQPYADRLSWDYTDELNQELVYGE